MVEKANDGVEALLQSLLLGQPIENIAANVDPRRRDCFSAKLYKWLLKYPTYTSLYRDRKGVIYMGWVDQSDRVWGGARFEEVRCRKVPVIFYVKEELHKQWEDVTIHFWTRYLQEGIHAFPEWKWL